MRFPAAFISPNANAAPAGSVAPDAPLAPSSLRLASGAAVPPLIVGTARLGSPLPAALTPASVRAEGFRVLDAAVEAGAVAFDLAASYMVGGSERLVGSWLAAQKPMRDQLYFIGKGGHPLPLVAPNRLTPAALEADLTASLRRLGLESFDLYLLHRDHPGAQLAAIVAWGRREKERGRLRAFGVSNWTTPRIQGLDALARGAGLPLAASSPHFSLARWRRPPFAGVVSLAGDAAGLAFHAARQLPVLAWSPLGGGYFVRPQDRAAADPIYGTPANAARRQRLWGLAARRGVTPAELALAYVRRQPFPVYPIVAARAGAHQVRNLAAAALPLSAGECRWLEEGQENA